MTKDELISKLKSDYGLDVAVGTDKSTLELLLRLHENKPNPWRDTVQELDPSIRPHNPELKDFVAAECEKRNYICLLIGFAVGIVLCSAVSLLS